MTADFLKWFFAQKPYRPSRLVLKTGAEILIEKPSHVGFNFNDTIRFCNDKGMGLQTLDISDIVEIRQ